MIIWHMLTKSTDYIWMRPALLARKFRTVELRAGLPTSYTRRGSAYEYNIPEKPSPGATPRRNSRTGPRDFCITMANEAAIQKIAGSANIGVVYNIRVGVRAKAGDVKDHTPRVSPLIHVLRDELAALVPLDHLGISDALASMLPRGGHVLAPIAGQRIDHRR